MIGHSKVDMLFADNQVILLNLERNLQIAVHLLHQTCKNFGLQISTTLKTKVMAFHGADHIQPKIVEDGTVKQLLKMVLLSNC